MDGDSESSSFWQKLTKKFSGKNSDNVEQAIIDASQDGEIEAAEGSMLLRVLHLDELEVQDIMTPCADIKAIEFLSPISRAIETILESGHSRLPIYREDIDNMVGITYAKDLLGQATSPEKLSAPVHTVMRQPFFVPESKSVTELLNEFRAKKTHMAIILDEYGGTSGLVTIEDVIEEIVGDIEDEHDTPRQKEIEFSPDGSVILSGRAYLDDINNALNTNFDSDEVETIGGLLSHIAGKLPRQGDSFEVGDFSFQVLEADNRQVLKILGRRGASSGADADTGEATTDNAAQ